MKADPVQFLQLFGKNPHHAAFTQTLDMAERYLVQVLKRGTHCQTMDELRFVLYHQSRQSFLDLPPTSFATKGHILRAFYVTYMPLNCLDTIEQDPKNFGFEEQDGLIVPNTFRRLVQRIFPWHAHVGNVPQSDVHVETEMLHIL